MRPSKSHIIPCGFCGTKNRVPADKLGLTAKCGKCGRVLNAGEFFSAQPVTVSAGDFEDQVLNSPIPVLLDCWAPWCGPCKMIGPVMEELAVEWKGKIKICKLSVDQNQLVAAKYQIKSIPTLLIFANGRLKEALVGAVPKQQIVSKMAPFL